jgi:glycosyltransferase involved in cell wall biosynthesis
MADKVIVPNMFTQDDVAKTLGVLQTNLPVIYEAPWLGQRDDRGPVDTATEESYRTLQLNKPFVLYVGSMYPHKNIPGLLRAWEIYVKSANSNYELVLVGKPDYFSERIKKLYGHIPQVRWLGFVSDTQLQVLYARAALLVVPSLYEGFGLPPLEAFMYGVPVVSSDRACLPEVLGTGALYVDPENSAQFASAIHRGLTDENVRQELKNNSREELNRYSPLIMAKQTVEVYEKVLKSAK